MNTQIISIEELCIGHNLVNLGKVLEIEERESCYSLIIDRMHEKQVWQFNKGQQLVVEKELK
jgi:hypothetical protein